MNDLSRPLTGHASALLLTVAVLGAAIASCSGKSDDAPSGAAATGGTGGAGAGSGGSAGGGSSGVSGGAGAGGGGAGTGGKGGAGGTGNAGSSGAGGSAGGAGTEAQAGAGQGGMPSCEVAADASVVTRHGQRARSSGFSGTEEDYAELYSLPCEMGADCAPPCLERGGTEEMCAGNLCIESMPNYCLPATVWQGLNALYAEGTDPLTDGAGLVTVSDPYRDYLLVDDFKLEIPEGAEILGITATIRRATSGANEAVDAAVRLIKGGVMGGSDRSSPVPWSAPDFVDEEYGGPTDLWGESWTAAEVNADDFGVALAVGYPQTGGSGRAYVDIVRVTVSYAPCE